jgi:alanyl-tRNA synthetase
MDKPTSSAELREAFLRFFAERGHERVASSSLVPANDPTLLFTNAGMVQFKDVFLGTEKRSIPRATTAQRCVRAGGKHNDLENVGYTARHHTFFEMLGNFSFGDYFKREAIQYAWEFVTGELGLLPERLWCTVYENDDEAADIWLNEIGIDPTRFGRLGEKDNFWAMGDTGPCGPCTEIFYDHGPEVAGGPPGSPDEDGDRYIEIWNLVFMQFDRAADGTMTPLPKPSVDTGMGLERLAAVMQGVHSNYEIDLFASLIRDAAAIAGTTDLENKALRVIADHIRACSFLVADGVLPSNEGRGYVLRRIIRRAIRYGYRLGIEEPFFYRLVASVEREMGAAHPSLTERREQVERVLLQEEQRFAETLSQGMKLLEEAVAGLAPGGEIPGETVFRLYDTYGFPEDLTTDFAREHGLRVDRAGFEAAMEQQRDRARSASRFGSGEGAARLVSELNRVVAEHGFEPTSFLGYEQLEAEAGVLALFDANGNAVEELTPEHEGAVLLERTPFYAESGGQVGDTGALVAGNARFDVTDTRKFGAMFLHFGRLAGAALTTDARVEAHVDARRRAATVRNHSATHLLHAALRTVVGEHVQQKGSLVAPERLRFDFTHFEPVTREQLLEIERLVNEQIRENAAAETREMAFDDAIAAGALAFFEDKYGATVRVLRLGEFSTELCGGTHVERAGDIGLFKITSETGVAAGVRRIEAVTGRGALEWVERSESVLLDIAGQLRTGRDDAAAKVSQLLERSKGLEREIQALRLRLASGESRDLLAEAQEIDGRKVLVARMDGLDARTLRDRADQLRDKLGSSIVVLGAVEDDKVRLVVSVSADIAKTHKAGELIAPIAADVGGRGGGRPDFAQAGGSEPAKLDAALEAAKGRLLGAA